MRARAAIIGLLALCTCLIEGCAHAPAQVEGVKAVAVWNLENLSLGDTARPDLGELLASEVIQTVKEKGEVQVVERERLVAVLEELNLGSSGLADESAKLKVGRMIGAREMVFGSYLAVGTGVRIDLRRVDVETGKVVKAAGRVAMTSDLTAWIQAARDAAAELYEVK